MVMKNAPRIFKKPKQQTFLVETRPGSHSKNESISLADVLKFVNVVDTTREAKRVINEGKVLVDGKARKDYRYPTGIFDIITIPAMKESYRIIPGKKSFNIVKIPDKEKKLKLLKIKGKKRIKGGDYQLVFNDGKTLVTKRNYKTKGSLLVSIPDMKVKKELKREKGSKGLIIGGKNQGKIGEIKDIEITKSGAPNRVHIDIGRVIDVPENLIFVINEDITVKEK